MAEHDAAPRAQVWIESGMGHAETATTPELVARIAAWLADALCARSSSALCAPATSAPAGRNRALCDDVPVTRRD